MPILSTNLQPLGAKNVRKNKILLQNWSTLAYKAHLFFILCFPIKYTKVTKNKIEFQRSVKKLLTASVVSSHWCMLSTPGDITNSTVQANDQICYSWWHLRSYMLMDHFCCSSSPTNRGKFNFQLLKVQFQHSLMQRSKLWCMMQENSFLNSFRYTT